MILPVETARLLAVESIGSKSQWHYVSSILRVLSNNGHHVTVFTQFTDCERDNYTEENISDDQPPFIEINLFDALDLWGNP